MTMYELWGEIMDELGESFEILSYCEDLIIDEINCYDKEKSDELKRILLFKQNVDEIFLEYDEIGNELSEDYSDIDCEKPEELDQECQKYFVETINDLKTKLNEWEEYIDRAISLCDSYKNDDIIKEEHLFLTESSFIRQKNRLLKMKELYKSLF